MGLLQPAGVADAARAPWAAMTLHGRYIPHMGISLSSRPQCHAELRGSAPTCGSQELEGYWAAGGRSWLQPAVTGLGCSPARGSVPDSQRSARQAGLGCARGSSMAGDPCLCLGTLTTAAVRTAGLPSWRASWRACKQACCRMWAPRGPVASNHPTHRDACKVGPGWHDDGYTEPG